METFSPSFEATHLKTLEEEIAFLKEKLAAKEREVALKEKVTTQESQAKAIKETLEAYKGTPHHQVLHKDYIMPKEQAEAIVLQLTPEEHDNKISELLGQKALVRRTSPAVHEGVLLWANHEL